MIILLSILSLLFGVLFMGIGVIGMIRMPDTYCRGHALSMFMGPGVGGLIVSASLFFWSHAYSITLFFLLGLHIVLVSMLSHSFCRVTVTQDLPRWQPRDQDLL